MSAAPIPFQRVVPMPQRRRAYPRGRREYLAADELSRFLAAAKEFGVREFAMFAFALAHGARASEICWLRVRDLDFERGRVFVARLKGSEDSLQAMQPQEREALQAWLADCVAKGIRKADGDFVFHGRESASRERGLSRRTVLRLFEEVARRAGIDRGKRFVHVLKHSLAMRLLEAGENSFLIQKALGHRSISSTLAYSKPTDAQASAAIGRALAGIL